MEDTKWIHYQKNDKLYVVKVFHDKKEYYVGAYKDIAVARENRDKARARIEAGDTTSFRSRANGVKRKIQTDSEWFMDYLNYPSYMDQPEYRLRFAILVNSLRDICNKNDLSAYNQANNWIMGHVASTESFSFEEICDMFRINYAAVRDRIKNLDEETKIRIRNASLAD